MGILLGFRRLLLSGGFWDGFSVFARVGGAVIYAGCKIAADGLASANLLREIAKEFDLVATLCERGADVGGEAIFHPHGGILAVPLPPPPRP